MLFLFLKNTTCEEVKRVRTVSNITGTKPGYMRLKACLTRFYRLTCPSCQIARYWSATHPLLDVQPRSGIALDSCGWLILPACLFCGPRVLACMIAGRDSLLIYKLRSRTGRNQVSMLSALPAQHKCASIKTRSHTPMFRNAERRSARLG
jgi:hypothetical protein